MFLGGIICAIRKNHNCTITARKGFIVYGVCKTCGASCSKLINGNGAPKSSPWVKLK